MIRPSTLADILPLSDLGQETYRAAFGHSFAPPDLAAHLKKNLSPQCFAQIMTNDIVLVAELSDCLVGYVQFGRGFQHAAASPQDYELRRLYILDSFQNQGIGSRLMDTALAHPALQSAPQVFLDVWEHNSGAQRFYARYGFEIIGTRQFQVQSGAETSQDLVMVRRQLARS